MHCGGCGGRGLDAGAARNALSLAGRTTHGSAVRQGCVSARVGGLAVTEINVMSAGAVEGLLAAVVPEFTRASGIAVSKSFGTVGVVQKRLRAGEQADVIIMSGAAVDTLEQAGGALPGS